MELVDFKKQIVKANTKKHHFKVTNSNGVREAWRWIKKNKWLGLGQPITELQFGQIIKLINKHLQDHLLAGNDIIFPHRMGSLEIRKFEAKIECENGKILTNLPIDWQRTIELWWEDKEAYETKSLVRFEGCTRFAIYYNKTKAYYNNKSFYKFTPTRPLKKRLKDKITNEGFEALLLKKKNELY